MLWLIAVMVGLDLRRGISDHTLLCMFVYVPTKTHGSTFTSGFNAGQKARSNGFLFRRFKFGRSGRGGKQVEMSASEGITAAL